MYKNDAIASLKQYNKLDEVEVEPGDVLIFKVFPGWAFGQVELGITWGQKLLHKKSADEKFGIKLQGSSTSEHAAIGLSNRLLAEAAAEVHDTDEIPNNAAIVFKCKNKELAKGAVAVTKALCRIDVDTRPKNRNILDGNYDMGGAIKSLSQERAFKSTTNQFIEDIISFVYGSSDVIPNMFCSQLAVAAYESASVALYGKTCFGSDPRGVTPKYLEHLLNTSGNFYLAGKLKIPALILHTHKVIKKYEHARKWKQSSESIELVEILEEAWSLQAQERKGFGRLLHIYETYFGLNVKSEFRHEMLSLTPEYLEDYPAVKALHMKPKRNGRLYNMVFQEIAPLEYFM
ncbi:hypothetical protein [Vibrio coralliilyticus]|uniref:hypothetical protein n=1 Tax=Vibrio coralliilyticus TaxID=190893 RepID=UPI0006CC84FC|nr:hypothetical protein [Vibrio coralliilyticus]ANW26666.1 hypothetical protein BA953_21185 [Vibrio coralliilyticus]AXN33905.1 hypothetical protein DVV14_21975 [Vibrio coralliilyticus]KPH24553.1 hypothetical protein ADU60_24520 [Vibrio coralliilyticus]